jgi:tetratricopeptide (TPR) repeat protein
MQTYQQLNQPDKAIEAARKALEVNPDSREALGFLSYVFPFTFPPPPWQPSHAYNALGAAIQAPATGGAHVQTLTKEGSSGSSAPSFSSTGASVCENGGTAPCWQDGGPLDAYVTTQLARAESDAKHGLEVLEKWQKPAGATDEQFNQAVKGLRSVFNNAIGFVALQRKDYPSAMTSFKAAAEDNPGDFYTFYRLGLAYLYSTPADYDHAVWYIARAVSLAQASKNLAGDDIDKFLKRAYVNYHGNEQGLQDIVTQAATAVNPPDGFKVAQMETPKKTGDPNADNFNDLTFNLKLGGERAQKTWDAIKNQPIGLGGAIASVEPGKDPGTYSVRIGILPQSKATEGVYDVEVLDSAQPNVKNLAKGDLVRFQGTIDSYTATPNLVLTVKGTITDPDPLPDKPPAKEKPKAKAPVHHRPAPKPPA